MKRIALPGALALLAAPAPPTVVPAHPVARIYADPARTGVATSVATSATV